MFCRAGIAIALVFGGLGASPAAASGNSNTFEKTALSGEEIYLYGGSTLGPDCAVLGHDSVRATSGPSHGKVSIVNAKVYVHYPKDDVRSKCNLRKSDGTKILYRSTPGFKGRDHVVLSVHTYLGAAFSVSFDIKVE